MKKKDEILGNARTTVEIIFFCLLFVWIDKGKYELNWKCSSFRFILETMFTIVFKRK